VPDDAVDHGRKLLGSILPVNGDAGRKDVLEVALRQLAPEHFADPQQRQVFRMLADYLDWTGTVLPQAAVADMLREQPAGLALQYAEYYAALQAGADSPDQAAWHVRQLRQSASERVLGAGMSQSMEILRHGARTAEGEWIRGYEPARDHLMGVLADVEHTLRLQEAPEGNVRGEAAEILGEYDHRAERSLRGWGVIRTGFPELDHALGGGVQPGELVLIAGNTNIGKSTICADWAWRAMVEQGRNVVIFTSETSRVQMRHKLIARHSRLSAWREYMPEGINTRDLRGGTLSPEHRAYLDGVVTDFTTNPAYGQCWVSQVPREATIGMLETRLARVSRLFPADLVIIDYLMLLRSDRRRQSRREELSEIVIAGKAMATGYQNGRGVPVVSPWQMNRAGNKAAAEQRGFYTTDDLAETAESSCTADVILGVLPDAQAAVEEGSNFRRYPIKIGTPKVRDGERLREQIPLYADYATCYFTPRNQGEGTAQVREFGGTA
jgi:replicative DNA helicase